MEMATPKPLDVFMTSGPQICSFTVEIVDGGLGHADISPKHASSN
jgi:hypothetical protein